MGQQRSSRKSSRHQLPRNQNRTGSPSLASSDHTGDGFLAMDASQDERIVEYLRDATSKDPNNKANWQFFLDSKGKSLSDPDLVRINIFAVEFMEKWQDVRITVRVSWHSARLPGPRQLNMFDYRTTASVVSFKGTSTRR